MGKDGTGGLLARLAASAGVRSTPDHAVLTDADDRRRRAQRVLRIAADLFEVRAAALVADGTRGPRIDIAWARAGWHEAEAMSAAANLRDVLKGTEAAEPAGVLEDVAPGRGFRAAAPVVGADGRWRGALCLVDPHRRTLLSGLQRRLFAAFGGLLLQVLDDGGAEDAVAEARDRAA